jgi:hypothetical protein
MSTELLECGHAESPHSDFTRGYGTRADGSRHCYACCQLYLSRRERFETRMVAAGIYIGLASVFVGACLTIYLLVTP